MQICEVREAEVHFPQMIMHSIAISQRVHYNVHLRKHKHPGFSQFMYLMEISSYTLIGKLNALHIRKPHITPTPSL